MSTAWVRLGVSVLALAVLSAGANATGAEEKEGKIPADRAVTLKQVPAKVKATILKAAGKNKLKELEETVLKLYEAEWTAGNVLIEIFVTPDGNVLMKRAEKEEANKEKEKAGKKEQKGRKEVKEEEDEDDEEMEAKEHKGKKEAKEDEDADDGEVAEKEIGIDELPAKVKATVMKLARKNSLKLEELLMKFYEAEWVAGDQTVEVLVAADGTLIKRPAEKQGTTKKKAPSGKGDDDDDRDDKD